METIKISTSHLVPYRGDRGQRHVEGIEGRVVLDDDEPDEQGDGREDHEPREEGVGGGLPLCAGFDDVVMQIGAEYGEGAVEGELKEDDVNEESGPIIQLANRIIEDAYFSGHPLFEADREALAEGLPPLPLVTLAIVSVLPLSILPFVPEQSITHYGAHVVYAVGQIPLIVLGYRALRGRAAAADPAGTSVRVS